MQVFKFHERESRQKIECLEGRWDWQTTKYTEKNENGEDRCMDIEWIDLFGIEEAKTFKIKPILQQNCNFAPLNRQYGLISIQMLEERPPRVQFWAVKFDWSTGTSRLGQVFTMTAESNRLNKWNILLNKTSACSSTHLEFLFYAYRHLTHVHCRLNTQTLEIEQLGSPFQLTPENFNCLNFIGSIVSGLASSLDAINQFDIQTRTSTSIQIHGLPSNIRCVCTKKRIEGDNHGQLRAAGAWTNDGRRLFVWSEYPNSHEILAKYPDLHEEQWKTKVFSKIYMISIDSGQVTELSQEFKYMTGRLVVSPDDRLYLRSDQFIVRRFKSDIHCRVANQALRPALRNFHLYRIPIDKPESLFFLAAAAVPRPLSVEVRKVLEQHREPIPRQIYNCPRRTEFISQITRVDA